MFGMLKHHLIHPKINEVIGRAGHHGTILVADGNYPASSKRGPNAEVVCLNLMPGIVSCTHVLRAVLSAVPIEAVQTMMYETSGPYALTGDPPVWDEYRREIREAGLSLALQPIEKWSFYEAVATPDHVLTIQTADQQRYANILLTIGVRMD
jgi:L-fucose mutarotase